MLLSMTATRNAQTKTKLRLYYESVIEDPRSVAGGGPTREERAEAAKELKDLLIEFDKLENTRTEFDMKNAAYIASLPKRSRRGRKARAEAAKKLAERDAEHDPVSDVLLIQRQKVG